MKDTLKAVLAHKGAKVHCVVPDATVLDAVRKMNEEHIGALLVRDGTEVVGIFTERDVLCRVLDSKRSPEATRVREVMTEEVVAVGPDTGVKHAMAIITERRCRHLPVMEDGELKGMVSIGDLTRWVSRHQEGHIRDLVNFITGKYPV
ncbi:MAG TPA: CBS domain-containing protein [Chondromyces sp.]|jgi:CBS domain-containing protein|nr:CBS domain-containing protein [Chondromyces sp.]